MESYPWNTGAVVIVIVNDMVEFATMGRTSTVARTKTRRMARSTMDGEVINTVALNHYSLLQESCTFEVEKIAYRHQRHSCTRREVKAEHLTVRSPRAYFSRCAPCSTVVSHFMFHPLHLPWLKT